MRSAASTRSSVVRQKMTFVSMMSSMTASSSERSRSFTVTTPSSFLSAEVT